MFTIYFYRKGDCIKATDNLDYTEAKRLLSKYNYQNVYKNSWYKEKIDMYGVMFFTILILIILIAGLITMMKN